VGVFAQIPINLGLAPAARFDSFVVGENSQILRCLMTVDKAVDRQVILLWGASGVGKSHLSQAVCQYYAERQKTVMYLPLTNTKEMDVDVLDGVETLDIVCVDDIHVIAGKSVWERALFSAYNRMDESGSHCVLTSTYSPKTLPIALPDLQSRLRMGLVYQLQVLDDEGKINVLRRRAQDSGFDLPHATADFLLRRHSRDLGGLCQLLEQLDQASLSAQRRITIPFIKSVLAENESSL
jgi:DnaA-homolog protein